MDTPPLNSPLLSSNHPFSAAPPIRFASGLGGIECNRRIGVRRFSGFSVLARVPFSLKEHAPPRRSAPRQEGRDAWSFAVLTLSSDQRSGSLSEPIMCPISSADVWRPAHTQLPSGISMSKTQRRDRYLGETRTPSNTIEEPSSPSTSTNALLTA